MSIDNLLRKKGIYQLLKTLKIYGDNYNSIKERISDKISARTLDHRLNELSDLGIINNRTIEDDWPHKKIYFLTNEGIIILSTLEMIEKTLEEKINKSEVPKIYRNLINSNFKLNFEKVWEDLTNMLSQTPEIRTLSKEKLNEIESIDISGIGVKTEKGTDKIPREKIEFAWKNLVQDGELYQRDHHKATYRSSFILALFSRLDYIKVNKEGALKIFLNLFS